MEKNENIGTECEPRTVALNLVVVVMLLLFFVPVVKGVYTDGWDEWEAELIFRGFLVGLAYAVYWLLTGFTNTNGK